MKSLSHNQMATTEGGGPGFNNNCTLCFLGQYYLSTGNPILVALGISLTNKHCQGRNECGIA